MDHRKSCDVLVTVRDFDEAAVLASWPGPVYSSHARNTRGAFAKAEQFTRRIFVRLGQRCHARQVDGAALELFAHSGGQQSGQMLRETGANVRSIGVSAASVRRICSRSAFMHAPG